MNSRVVTKNIFCRLCMYHEFGLAGQICKSVLFSPGGYLFASFASMSCFSPAVIYLLVLQVCLVFPLRLFIC